MVLKEPFRYNERFECPFSPGDMVFFKDVSLGNTYTSGSPSLNEKTSLMCFVAYDSKEACLRFINENGKSEVWAEHMFKVYSDCFRLAL
jgi:hypothetical protein